VSFSAGQRLGPYEVVGPLGSGGMGEVFAARDTRLDRLVAVKVLPRELASDPDRRARFEREARAISALSHPHVCALFDVGRTDGPDGRLLAYVSEESGAPEAYVVALAGGPPRRDLDFDYDVARDGQRFLVRLTSEPEGAAGLRVALEWSEQLAAASAKR
jgi:hypothetical protein